MRLRLGLALLGGVLWTSSACSSSPTPTTSFSGGSTSLAGQNGGGGASSSPAGASSQGGGAMLGGAGAGSASGSTSGNGGATGGGAGTLAQGGATVGGNGGASGSGSGVPAGCANDPHPICIDFESGIDKNVWTNGTDAGISTLDKAHGQASYHAYKGAGVLQTSKFGPIKNVLWGRFYLRMSPGAPGGHGNIVGAYEGGDWYELGWQFNGLMGVWHYAGGENPLRSHPTIVDQWYCVELLFDGTKTEMQHWYVDGKEVEYYMGEPNNKKPHVITQFDKLTVGFTSYAGLGLNPMPYGNNDPPVMTDMWLDDIAFDVKRIGCIGP